MSRKLYFTILLSSLFINILLLTLQSLDLLNVPGMFIQIMFFAVYILTMLSGIIFVKGLNVRRKFHKYMVVVILGLIGGFLVHLSSETA
jgi:hypothetical protein